MPRNKRFNKEWHDSNDPKSRRVVIAYMKSIGFGFHENPDQYGVDLISDFENPKVGLELEHRSIWVREQYPYGSVNIPYRKLKFIGGNNIHYVIISEKFDRLGICLGRNLKKYINSAREVKNSAVGSKEYFFDVPAHEFKWVKIC